VLDPDNLESRSKLGEAYVRKGELNSAIEQFQQVLEDDPQNAAALAALGHAFYLNKDLASAVSALKQALSIEPDFPVAENELARISAATTDPNLRNSAPQQAAAHPAPQP
jgi:superkiller protein 3